MELTITITLLDIVTAIIGTAILLWLGLEKGGLPGMMHR